MKTNSRTALMVSGAIAGLVAPLLATDAKVDLSDALKDVTGDTLAADGKPGEIAAKVVELVTPHLATDKAIDADAVTAAIAGVTPLPMAEDAITQPEPKPAPKPKVEPAPVAGLDAAAVDAKVAEAVATAEAKATAIRVAEREVRPVVGEVAAMDSAASIYRLGLDALGVDHKGVADDALGALFRAVPKKVETVMAVDANPADFRKRFPDAVQLVRS